MIRPRRLARATEHLDQIGHDATVLERDLLHIENVNRWLGGLRAVLHSILPLLREHQAMGILDVGCGGGDVPRAVAEAAARLGGDVHVVALDRHPQILDIARRRTTTDSAIQFVRADGRALPFPDGAFDVVVMSLAFHHFEQDDRGRVLRELARVARHRVIINELERCWPNYVGARLLAATVWRNNPMARHDGPISVLRAFTRTELRNEMQAAGLTDIRVERRFFHRLLASASPASARRAAVATLA